MAAKKKATAFSFGKTETGAPWSAVAPFIADDRSVKAIDWPLVWSLSEAEKRRAIARGTAR